jgi:hypothetical protein
MPDPVFLLILSFSKNEEEVFPTEHTSDEDMEE